MRIQVLNSINGCLNPNKCHYPDVEHENCGNNFIVVKAKKISLVKKIINKLKGI